MLKKIHYSHPVVASFLLLGSLFFILGISKDFIFLIMGVILIVSGIRANSKIVKE